MRQRIKCSKCKQWKSLNTKTITTHTNKELKDELNKCILLCKNCHSEIENKEDKQNVKM